MNIHQQDLHITYAKWDGTEEKAQAPLAEVLKRACRPPGIFEGMNVGGLRYHTQLLEEVRAKVAKKECYTVEHTWEQTVALLIDVAKQVGLMELIKEHIIGEAPLPAILMDSIQEIQVLDRSESNVR